ncbi:ORFL43C [Human betaherpesvirus 5]|nr:ORFL43C [Human betaherpesvirus 5]QHX40335.1 ORFL43C [Human betaherpesvirus 5]
MSTTEGNWITYSDSDLHTGFGIPVKYHCGHDGPSEKIMVHDMVNQSPHNTNTCCIITYMYVIMFTVFKQ